MAAPRKWKPKAPAYAPSKDCSHSYAMDFPKVCRQGDTCECSRCGQVWILTPGGWSPVPRRSRG